MSKQDNRLVSLKNYFIEVYIVDNVLLISSIQHDLFNFSSLFIKDRAEKYLTLYVCVYPCMYAFVYLCVYFIILVPPNHFSGFSWSFHVTLFS